MKLRGLELLRGLAAFAVAVEHSASSITNNPALGVGASYRFDALGMIGVEFFFVLSGFVMGLMHAAEIGPGGRPLRFLWRRVCRIYPLFLIVLASELWRFRGAPMITTQNALEWASLLPVRLDNFLVVAWTLRHEVVFYAVFALCLLPRAGLPILLAWAAALTVQAASPLPLPGGPVGLAAFHLLSGFNFEFLAGLLAAVLLRKVHWPSIASTALIAVGGGLVIARLATGGWGAEYGPPIARVIDGVGYGSILLGVSALERAGRLRFTGLWNGTALVAGAISYPLYLCHVPVIGHVSAALVGTGLGPSLGSNLVLALFLVVSLLVAAVLTFFVDRPLQALLAGRMPSLIAGSRLGPAARG